MPKVRLNTSVDKHIGSRLRARRKAVSMNQMTLAQAIGVTFQMVQRYEYGRCRISASTLYAVAVALGCPVAYFFDGLSAETQAEAAPAEHAAVLAALPRIRNRDRQRVVADLVAAIAQDEADEPASASSATPRAG